MSEGRSQLSETSYLVYRLKETDPCVIVTAFIRFPSETVIFHTVVLRFLYQALSVKSHLSFLAYEQPLRAGLTSTVRVTESWQGYTEQHRHTGLILDELG